MPCTPCAHAPLEQPVTTAAYPLHHSTCGDEPKPVLVRVNPGEEYAKRMREQNSVIESQGPIGFVHRAGPRDGKLPRQQPGRKAVPGRGGTSSG